ncbi:PREDICTED: phosphoinositide phosphatase SAC8-like [Camelina sativa]|uniref:Phosphoinositide phosphatase SAC8-like n=1 Tax=Camelina sativa TaxID=90675 RepID=A0ABM1RSB8_CAMSA|nr:PREDICTED: phosphoinositide phosphatase SAC8-like [Camelina sativa]
MEIAPSSSRFKLNDQFKLLEFPDKYVVTPVDSPHEGGGFSVNRRDGNIKPLDEDASSENPTKFSTIYGVGGTIRLLAGTYLLVITSREKAGSFLGFPIFRVTGMKFLPCNEAFRFATAQEKKDEAYFRTLLQALEATPGLYFSYETDLTLNLQRRCKLAEGWNCKPIWKQADPRFVWNWRLLEELIECKLEGFILPLLQGSYQVAELKLKNSPAVISLISRRCTRRLGTRMWRRGANLEGDTANFVETEQIVEINGFKFSVLQVRGSIPLLWEQIVDLSYKPQLKINKHEETVTFVRGSIPLLWEQIVDLSYKPQLKINKHEETLLSFLFVASYEKSYMAQKILNLQLQRIGVFDSTDCVSLFEDDYTKFRTIWAEQGDEISLQYAGTYALKGDLVRYGKQTMAGAIKDGISAMSRYYLNNFQDGVRQDALDLISGRYTVGTNSPSQLQRIGAQPSFLPVASALLIGGVTVTSFSIHQAGRNTQQYLATALWAGVTAGVVAMIKANGRHLCSRPRLCHLI